VVGLDEGRWDRRCRGLTGVRGASRVSRSILGQFRTCWISPAFGGMRRRLRFPLSATVERPTQNWHDPGESDCLIKTKHCDGRKSVLTQCDFCPVL